MILTKYWNFEVMAEKKSTKRFDSLWTYKWILIYRDKRKIFILSNRWKGVWSGTGFDCNPGFELVDGICKDINECELTVSCATGKTCLNIDGSFLCLDENATECPAGFEGRGGFLLDFPSDEKNPDPPQIFLKKSAIKIPKIPLDGKIPGFLGNPKKIPKMKISRNEK